MATTTDLVISVKDFSESPGPRYCSQGECSGEEFYHTVVNKQFTTAYQTNKTIRFILDGVDGYMSSFLDEAFGNLIYDFGRDQVVRLVSFVSDEEPEWKKMLFDSTFPEWEKRRREKEQPKITKQHDDWHKLCNGKLITVNYNVEA
jgi:hypothetical protein